MTVRFSSLPLPLSAEILFSFDSSSLNSTVRGFVISSDNAHKGQGTKRGVLQQMRTQMTSLSVQDDNLSSQWLVLPTLNKIVKETISFLTDKASVDVERSSLGVA